MQVVRTETQAKKNLSQGRKIHKIQTGIMLDENYKKTILFREVRNKERCLLLNSEEKREQKQKCQKSEKKKCLFLDRKKIVK